MENQSAISDFLHFEFSDLQEQQMLYFLFFMLLYLAIITANLLIVFAILWDHHLHTPMYLFLMNLAIQDLGSVSAIVPQTMANMLMNTGHISYFGCVSQVFFALFFMTSDFWTLTVMAYDRYVAICNPLQYETIMNKQSCIYMLLAVWVSSLLYGLLHTGFTFASHFCSNIVNQFFCEIAQLLKLTCSDFNQLENNFILFSSLLWMLCFLYIFATYVSILYAVLKIPSKEGRKKAYSTCLPHFIVVTMYLISGCVVYLSPPSRNLDLAFTVAYSLAPPLLNPIIYSMRNKQIKTAMSKLLNFGNCSIKKKIFFFLFLKASLV